MILVKTRPVLLCLQGSSSSDCSWRQKRGQGPAAAAGQALPSCSLLPGKDSPPPETFTTSISRHTQKCLLTRFGFAFKWDLSGDFL